MDQSLENRIRERLKLLAQALPQSSHPEAIKDHVTHFLAGYRLCANNRNILMHSMTAFVWLDPDAERCPALNPAQPDGVVFQKWPKSDPFNITIYSPGLDELRGVADSMKALEEYGTLARSSGITRPATTTASS